MFERFTTHARAAVVAAREEALASGAPTIGAHHLLLGLLHDDDCLAGRVLSALGVEPGELRAAVATRAAGAQPGAPAADGLDDDDIAALRAIGIDAEEVLRRMATDLGGLPPHGRAGGGRVPMDADTKKALELALREAIALKHRSIGTEHVLLGLLRGGSPVVAAASADLAVTHARAREVVRDMLRRSG